MGGGGVDAEKGLGVRMVVVMMVVMMRTMVVAMDSDDDGGDASYSPSCSN